MSTTMRAVVFTRYGGPEVTQVSTSVPVPQPKKGEVQVRVAAGGLNPIDWHQRAGELKAIMPYKLPVVAGNEFSGEVSLLGEDVTGFAIGDKVICRVRQDQMGGLGEYVVMPASLLAKAPTSIPLTDAAGLPLAGLTALQSLDTLDVKAGDRILITGGAGGVGLFGIQLAKIRGAHVTTTASDEGKPYVLKAGADEVINYKTQKLSELSEKFTKVFDAAGGDEALVHEVIPATAEGGHIVSIAGAMTPGLFDSFLPGWKAMLVNFGLGLKSRKVRNAAAARKVNYQYIFMRPDGTQLQHLANLIDEGKLVINIDSRFKVADYAKAYERLESGRSKGKIIIEFDETPAAVPV
ncbi:chaperonin 10-like protein [Papiliotrema laurentii]|uniref:Chaperonin 10-like protein n=1 Tax=Papiliotrema laurentii TaxID=5418 RepID=A0AAD9CYT5_PAPLA|nr:chaperonin 10-like protein [Papiliotrema laurentii]